ncbi:energy transducer TonB [Hellea balneolensis]|uniref:energy transducer TonB n=1 Tax=Hellea balneolensis TaxID=287478 RepID=UPI0012B901FE|nr:energy transducer TonB [Hellea balneolensis]
MALSGSANAKTPSEVLKPYKEYRAALKSGDKEKALKAARKAWDRAENLIGDSTTTASLAQNYADLQRYDDFEEAIKGFKRAVELSPQDSEEEKGVRLERLIKLSEMYIATPKYKRATKHVSEANNLILSTDLLGSTIDGEIKTLSGWLQAMKGNEIAAIKHFDNAIAIFDNPTEKYQSVFPYLVRIYKGDTLRNKKDPIKAALEYQVVMQNLEGTLDKDHPFVKSAFGKWLWMRSLINDSDKNEEALEAGVCKCWPYDEMRADSAIPVMRIPPIMPSRARRSGHVNFKFDVSDEGKPINVEVVSATEDVFVKPATKSLKEWDYEPIQEDDTPESRKGLVTKITFRLTDERGNILPEKPL